MTPAQARSMFASERATFAKRFPRVASVRFRLRKTHYLPASQLTPRDLAWFDIDANMICLTRAALAKGPNVVRGIIRHELGHAADSRVNSRGSERRADRIALTVTGEPIRYTADGLQNTDTGVPRRPAWLHQ